MTATVVGQRLDRLASVLGREGVDAIFFSSPISMGYLHGFFEGGGERFLILALHRDGRTRMICPALSAVQAVRCGIADVRGWRDGEDPMAHFAELAQDWNLRTAVVAIDDDMPASYLLAMQTALPAALFRTGQSLLAELMRVKDAAELDQLRLAGAIADESLEAALAVLRPGITEIEIERALSTEMQRRGATPAFAIVAAGANAAEPHHHSDDTCVEAGDVVILDFGCNLGGYLSDITRTVALGDPGDEARKVYGIVYRAFMAGRDAIRAGVTAQEVDRRARKVIDDAGYGEFFIHRTGHGIGMRVHEEPFIIEGNTQVLAPGNCFSVEPGIYLPGRFGVRIENIVTVTADGHESLNAEPAPEILIV